jgi:HEPN domain-containing protein
VDRSRHGLAQDERDVAAAETSAAAGFHEWAAFAAQQGAEKAVKALAQSEHGSPRSHSVTLMLRDLKERRAIPEPVIEAARQLDQVYVTSRYPNGFSSGTPADHFSAGTSLRLIAHARTIVEFCRSALS